MEIISVRQAKEENRNSEDLYKEKITEVVNGMVMDSCSKTVVDADNGEIRVDVYESDVKEKCEGFFGEGAVNSELFARCIRSVIDDFRIEGHWKIYTEYLDCDDARYVLEG